MAPVNPFAPEIVRIRIVVVFMLAALALLCIKLWEMQVGEGLEYRESLEQQSIRRVGLPGRRGMIFDRNGVCLADNYPDYCIAIYLEELRRNNSSDSIVEAAEKTIQRISGIIGIPPEVDRKDIQRHLEIRKPMPLLAWTGVDDAALARLAESDADLTGVDVYVRAQRSYPCGSLAAHVLGHVGRSDPCVEDGVRYHYYLPDMIGKAGLEEEFDNILRGVSGGLLVRVDVSGYKYEEVSVRTATPGGDIRTSLDINAQRLAEEVMSDVAGAVVVLDPENGDVLALASSPTFDPNWFSPSLSAEKWERMRDDPGNPLFCRATMGAYPPGSTFKPVVALAALNSGRVDRNTEENCPGYFDLGKTSFSCYHNIAHGNLKMLKALELSCNVFFYQIGLRCGHEAILSTSASLGLGRKTGIALETESPGLLPSGVWKKRERGDMWRDGDTCNLSIGQGFLLVTPLQMAVVTSAIANWGRVYRPRLVLDVRARNQDKYTPVPVELLGTVNCSKKDIAIVRAGMRNVIQAARGTGRAARIPGVEMAGKTGTAEYGVGKSKKYAWMLAFAPYDAPRFALAMVVEEGVSGGTTAGPRVKKIMSGLLGIRKDEDAESENSL